MLEHTVISERVVNYKSIALVMLAAPPVAPMSQGNMSCRLSGASGTGRYAQVHTITHTHIHALRLLSTRVHSVSNFQ